VLLPEIIPFERRGKMFKRKQRSDFKLLENFHYFQSEIIDNFFFLMHAYFYNDIVIVDNTSNTLMEAKA